jgi:HK97 gp10 family phage protein
MRSGQFRPEVLAAISQAPSVKRQVRAVANEVRKIARRKAVKKTGSMAKGIQVENSYDSSTGLVEYHVGWNKRTAWYGLLVELGTEDTAAHPHLRPAADEVNNRGGSAPADDGELIDYTTKSGKTRKATRAQVANWTRSLS